MGPRWKRPSPKPRPSPPRTRGPRPPWARRLAWPVLFVAAGLALFAAYLRQAQTVPVNSDGGSFALQAWDMLHGNVLLRGWTTADLTFYTTELPQYALVELAHGLNADVVHIAGAMSYTLLVLGAALLARGRAAGREGAVRMLIAGGIMLAPSLGTGSHTLLSSADHTGTQVPMLVIWLILDRARPRWWVPVVVSVLLAWVQVGDPLALYEGVVPLVIVCVIRMYRRRGSLRENWYELSLAAGAIVSAGVASLALKLIHQLGGFAVRPPSTALAHIGHLPSNVWVTVQSVLVLFGADFSGQQNGAHIGIALVHLAGVALAAWAAGRALRRFGTQDLVVQVLTVTLVVLLAAYVVRGNPNVAGSAHEIAGVLPIGAVLAGRLLAGTLARAGCSSRRWRWSWVATPGSRCTTPSSSVRPIPTHRSRPGCRPITLLTGWATTGTPARLRWTAATRSRSGTSAGSTTGSWSGPGRRRAPGLTRHSTRPPSS